MMNSAEVLPAGESRREERPPLDCKDMLERFWRAVLVQDRDAIRPFFLDGAFVNWHCTNEHFTAEEFIQANCEYPGQWEGTIERTEYSEDAGITVVRVYPKDRSSSFHVVSFFRIQQGKIAALEEYWADDGPPPQWRQAMHIGTPIRGDNAESLSALYRGDAG